MSITKEENSAFVVNQNQTTPDQPKDGKCWMHLMHLFIVVIAKKRKQNEKKNLGKNERT